MPINTGVPLRVAHINGVPISVWTHCHTAHIPVRDRLNLEPAAPLRLDVNPTVKVIAPQFREGSAQHQWNV